MLNLSLISSVIILRKLRLKNGFLIKKDVYYIFIVAQAQILWWKPSECKNTLEMWKTFSLVITKQCTNRKLRAWKNGKV